MALACSAPARSLRLGDGCLRRSDNRSPFPRPLRTQGGGGGGGGSTAWSPLRSPGAPSASRAGAGAGARARAGKTPGRSASASSAPLGRDGFPRLGRGREASRSGGGKEAAAAAGEGPTFKVRRGDYVDGQTNKPLKPFTARLRLKNKDSLAGWLTTTMMMMMMMMIT